MRTKPLMNTNINKTAFVLLVLLWGFTSNVLAERSSVNTATLPAYYPGQFQHTGKISDIETSNSIIISGLRYNIASYAKLHTKATKYATLGSLQVGHEVGFTATTGYNNSRKITELWVLPAGSVKLH